MTHTAHQLFGMYILSAIVGFITCTHHHYFLCCVQLWSGLSMPGFKGNLVRGSRGGSMTRRVYTHEEYIGLVLESGQVVGVCPGAHTSIPTHPLKFFQVAVIIAIFLLPSLQFSTVLHSTAAVITSHLLSICLVGSIWHLIPGVGSLGLGGIF